MILQMISTWLITMPLPGTIPIPVALFVFGLDFSDIDWISGLLIAVKAYLAMVSAVFACRCVYAFLSKVFGWRHIIYFHVWTLMCPWRLPYLWWERVADWLEEGTMLKRSTGGFANMFSVWAHVYKPGDLFLGTARVCRLTGHQPIGLRDPQKGVCVFAEPGAGKTNWLKTVISTHTGPCLYFDPDGSITTTLKRRLSTGGGGIIGKTTKDGKPMTFAALDPKGMVGESASWNFFKEVTSACKRHGVDMASEMFDKMAEGLIRQTDQHQQVFAEVSRTFAAGLGLVVWLVFPECCNLITFRRLLTQGWIEGSEPGEDPWIVLLDFMFNLDLEAVAKTNPHGLFPDGTIPEAFADKIRSAAAMMKSGQSRDGKNPFRTPAIDQTSFMDNPGWRRISERSDFELFDLKETLNLAIIAPVGDMRTTFSSWFRLLTITTFTIFENSRPSKSRFLFCLEECPAFGKIERLPVIASNCRRYSMRLLMINQDKGQLDALYGKEAETLISSGAEATIFMGTGHSGTQQYLSAKLGKRTRTEKVSAPWYVRGFKPSYNSIDRDVMPCEAIDRYLNPRYRNIIVKLSSRRAWRLKQGRFMDVLPVSYYDADLNFKETRFRAYTRDRNKIRAELQTAN